MKNLGKVAAIAAVLLGVHFGVQAQTESVKTVEPEVSVSDAPKYTRFAMSYEMTGFTANDKLSGAFDDRDSRYLNGFGLALVHGSKLPHNIPLFIEIGLKFHMGFYSKDSEKLLVKNYRYSDRMQNLTFTVTLNFNYRFKISETAYVAPFVGLNMKVNAMLRSKREFEHSYYKDFGLDKEELSKWRNLLSSKDSKGNETKDEPWKVIQFGWQAGVGFNFGDLYLGVSYGTDFVPAYKVDKARINSSTLSLTLAITLR